MDLELSGRVAIVTGASKGIGLAIVRTLAEEGALVVATSRTRAEEWPDTVVSSGSARQPGAMNIDYAAAKSAMNHVGKAVSEEYGAQGIRVNTLSPGPTLSDMWTRQGGSAEAFGALTGTSKEDVIAKVAPEMMRLVTGRLVHAQEIADAIALLVSPRSGSTTGADVAIDGGYLEEL
ncbi:SDR family oxidoreductase [Nonomuraea sp. K274]|uniref:SDR family oxidoreductase n=1 Tax=Nonomuraea cypriaca TaxID=1187855 RepID=A0A931A8E8_9ACTN|nr:SDR family oxidoreductase [Nonomuraea cypriaca]MBF8184712.1 SDR family oxidoreductase [Nonomuraea cypriaca]